MEEKKQKKGLTRIYEVYDGVAKPSNLYIDPETKLVVVKDENEEIVEGIMEGKELTVKCAHCGRPRMFQGEGGRLADGRWFCSWACRKALLKKAGLVGVR